MPPRAACVPTLASAGKKNGYKKLAAPTTLTNTSRSVPAARLFQESAMSMVS
jgi:hypothetical protein